MAGVDGSKRARTIAQIDGRLVLDSHLAWTPEFDVRLADGAQGRGSAPRGETVSTAESALVATDVRAVIEAVPGLVGGTFDQPSFDTAIGALTERFGRGTTLALSTAFYLAWRTSAEGDAGPAASTPRLLLNLLNGGLHAYTNPITADMPEFMLLARSDDLRSVADAYVGLLESVHERLRRIATVDVGGNRVHDLGAAPNEAALGLIVDLLRSEGLDSAFSIAVDASAGDWAAGDGYVLPVSGARMSAPELGAWWLRLVDGFGIELLEDPFAEHDRRAWIELHETRPAACRIFGDNYTSSDVRRLVGEGRAADVDGVLVKPNQNGTVTGTLGFAAAARAAGLAVVASHRSVETESTILIDLAREMGAEAIKIGPFRDYTAVVKFNALLRSAAEPWRA